MSVNKYTWKWSATKANGQLVGQTAVEGQKPLLSILPDGKLKMTKFRMMGSEETTFTLVQAFEAPAYSDLNTFWRDFKAAALAKNYAKIQTLTKYPFYNHMGLESAEQFKEFEFPDYLLKALATAQAPKKSTMVFENYKQGSLWEVDYGGPALYFTQHNGEWRFAGVLYGE